LGEYRSRVLRLPLNWLTWEECLENAYLKVQIVTMGTKLVFSMSDLARQLGVTPPAVRYWIDRGVIPEPPYQVGNAKVYTAAEYRRVLRRLEEVTGRQCRGVGTAPKNRCRKKSSPVLRTPIHTRRA